MNDSSLSVEVIRSPRRKKTAQARLVGDRLEVRIPAVFTADQEAEMVDHFVERFSRSRATASVDLEERAAALAEAYGLPKPLSIRWVTNQQHRWGSCTPEEGSVRISNRVANYPDWVLDYVIVHELAHFVVPGHNEEFWSLVARYPLTERARGYLIAKGHDGN